jgi:hypothetical protein
MVNYRWLALGIVLLALALVLFFIPWQALITLLFLFLVIGGSLVSPIYQRLTTLDQRQPTYSPPMPREEKPLMQQTR